VNLWGLSVYSASSVVRLLKLFTAENTLVHIEIHGETIPRILCIIA